VKSALAYPAVMVVAGIGAVIVMMTVVIPKIVNIFGELNQTLPTPTVILIAVSNFFATKGWILLLALGAAGFGIWRFLKTPDGQRMWSRAQLKAPLFGMIVLKREVARFARTLGALLANGVPILSSLEITQAVVQNLLVRDEVEKISENVTQGSGVARALKGSEIFPAVVVNMINVGEETGRLAEVLTKVASSYEIEVDRSVKTLTSLLEPMIIFLMALLVGFIVISMLLPIFSLDPTGGAG